MLQEEQEKMKVLIPKLKGNETYRSWYAGIKRFLQTRSLDIYIYYKFKTVKKLSKTTVKPEVDIMLTDKMLIEEVTTIPLEERIQLANEDAQNFSLNSPSNFPEELLGVIELTDVVQRGNHLTFLVSSENYVKLVRKLREERSRVFSLFHTTLSKPVYELIRNEVCTFEAFNILAKNFQLNPYIEQQNLRTKITKLYVGKLKLYLNSFEQLLAEYISIGGSRYDTAIYDTFIRHVKNSRYSLYYNIYNGTNIDDILDFFKPIADKETIEIPKSSDKNSSRRQANIHANKAQTSSQPPDRPFRCRRCNGWNHDLQSCPLSYDVCHYCGNTGHFRKECPRNQNKTRANQAQVTYSEEEKRLHTEQDNTSNTKNIYSALQDIFITGESSDSEDDFVTCNQLNIAQFNSQNNFILDSGATRHVTGNIKLLDSTRQL